MSRHTYFQRAALATATLFLLSSHSSAATLEFTDPHAVLRGFRIGAPCASQDPARALLQADGFNVLPARFVCMPQGRFVTDVVMLERGATHEIVETSYTPTGLLWRIKVTRQWDGGFRLEEALTPKQVQASLEKRFGTPYVFSRDGALGTDLPEGGHQLDFAWAVKTPASGASDTATDKLSWDRWVSSLGGVVTLADLRWADGSPKVSLVVQMTDRRVEPEAAAAGEQDRREAVQRGADRDASMLGSL